MKKKRSSQFLNLALDKVSISISIRISISISISDVNFTNVRLGGYIHCITFKCKITIMSNNFSLEKCNSLLVSSHIYFIWTFNSSTKVIIFELITRTAIRPQWHNCGFNCTIASCGIRVNVDFQFTSLECSIKLMIQLSQAYPSPVCGNISQWRSGTIFVWNQLCIYHVVYISMVRNLLMSPLKITFWLLVCQTTVTFHRPQHGDLEDFPTKEEVPLLATRVY